MNKLESKIIITTERLKLRTWLMEDIPMMALISSDPKVMEYFPATQDLKATERLINRINEQYKNYGYTLYATEIKETGEFIGFVGLSHPPFIIPDFKSSVRPIVEIGWRLSSDHWGKGYATEAAKAVLAYAFNVLNLNEIISFTTIANVRSRKVMEKIGLCHDEQDDFAHPMLDDNSPLTKHVLYRLTRDQYLTLK